MASLKSVPRAKVEEVLADFQRTATESAAVHIDSDAYVRSVLTKALGDDKAANLMYYGSANPSTWNPSQRPGDNKWTMTIFARGPSGMERRYFTSPGLPKAKWLWSPSSRLSSRL